MKFLKLGIGLYSGNNVRKKAASLLLDDYPNAYYGWSVSRRLSSSYSGFLIRVRRSNDNAELNIGYNGANELDVTALTTFVGSNSAFITTKYDQSGNGRNFVQITAANQPRIVNAGTIDTENGKPTSIYSGPQIMLLTGLIYANFPTSAINFYTFKLTGNTLILHNGSGSGSGSAWWDYFQDGAAGVTYANSGTPIYYKNGTNIAATQNSLYDNFINSPSLMTVKNINMQNLGWTTLIANGYGSSYNLKGTWNEDILFKDQSNSQTGIEANIKTYYGII